MKKADIIGWVGNIFFIVGAILIARQNIFGFISNGLGNVLYLIQAYMTGMKSLTALSLILIIVNGYGIYNWSK